MYDDNVNKCYSSKFYANGSLENKNFELSMHCL